MRRDEFASTEKSEFDFLMKNAEVGYLGLVDKNCYPRIVPINFTAIGKTIYFHGALEGEKFDLIKKNPKVAFSVDIPYSFIPSHWINKNYACTVTQFFKSVHIRGNGEIVDDVTEKAKALQALMEKYQPEGKFKTISTDHSIYRKALTEVGVFKIKSDDISLKIKFGQKIEPEKRQKIILGLRNRNRDIDIETLKEMNEFQK